MHSTVGATRPEIQSASQAYARGVKTSALSKLTCGRLAVRTDSNRADYAVHGTLQDRIILYQNVPVSTGWNRQCIKSGGCCTRVKYTVAYLWGGPLRVRLGPLAMRKFFMCFITRKWKTCALTCQICGYFFVNTYLKFLLYTVTPTVRGSSAQASSL